MRNIFVTLGFFVCSAISVSLLSGCSGTTTANSGNIPNPPGKSDPAKSIYPPLPAGVANAEMELLDGTKVKVSDRKGKALVINLWAIWCGFCREEMPHLDKWQKQYGDRLEVIGLSIGNNRDGAPEPVDDIKKLIADMKVEYTIGRSPHESTRQFYALSKNTAIPQTFMADADGRLRGVFVGGGQKNIDAMKAALDKILAE